MGECLVLLEGMYILSSVVSEVGGSSRNGNYNIDPQVEAGAVLGDLDKSVCITGHCSQFLEIICVPIAIVGALEV
jgi:hypothetical protein